LASRDFLKKKKDKSRFWMQMMAFLLTLISAYHYLCFYETGMLSCWLGSKKDWWHDIELFAYNCFFNILVAWFSL